MKHFFWAVGALPLIAATPSHMQNAEFDEDDIICVGCCYSDPDEQMRCVEAATGDDNVITIGTLTGGYDQEDLSPVTAISPQTLEDRNLTFAVEQLRTVPGVAISRSGNGGNLTQLRLRGSEANHTKVLLNGIDISDPATGEFDFGGLTMDGINKIEVLRGEGSALYGSDAIGGTINLLSKSNRSTRSFRSRLETGSEDSFRGSFGAELPLLDSFQIWGDAQTSAGFDVSPGGGEADGFSRRSLSVAAEQSLGEIGFSGLLSFSTQSNSFDSDSDFDGRLNDTNDELTTKRLFGFVRADFKLGEFENELTLSGTRTDAENPFASFRNDTTGERAQLQWLSSRSIGEGELALLGELKQESFDVFGGPGAGQNQTQSIDSQALAAEYIWQPGALTLAGSLRFDANERFDDAVNGRIAVDYDLSEVLGADSANHQLRASIATGTKNPTLTELFGFFPGSFIGNPNVTPEQSIGVNLGYTGEFDIITLSVDIFRSELRDEIVTRFLPGFQSTVDNLDTDSTREGAEFAFAFDPGGTLELNGQLTLLNSEQDGQDEIRRPETLASLSGTWRPTDALTLNLTANHTGEQIDTDFATFSNVTLDSYTLLSGNARFDMTDHFSVYVRSENLFDEDYRDVVGYNSQGRTVYVGLESRF